MKAYQGNNIGPYIPLHFICIVFVYVVSEIQAQ